MKVEEGKSREVTISKSYSLSMNICFVLNSTLVYKKISSGQPLHSGLILVLRLLRQSFLAPNASQKRVQDQTWRITTATTLAA